MSQWQRLGNDRCPTRGCNAGTGLRIHKKFRKFLQLALKKLEIDVPEGLAFSYRCSWCREKRTFEIRDLLEGPDAPLDESE